MEGTEYRGVSKVETKVHTVRCWMCGCWFAKGYTAHHCGFLNADVSISHNSGSVLNPPESTEKGFEEYEE